MQAFQGPGATADSSAETISAERLGRLLERDPALLEEISLPPIQGSAKVTFSAADIDDATNAMMDEASQHFRFGLFTRKRERVRALAEWCSGFPNIHYATSEGVRYWAVKNLRSKAAHDAELKEKCGSIFIMILANLLIQLFILWLKRRLDNQ